MTRLVVFGATGATGRHALEHALQRGVHVRAYVRSPDKLPASLRTHPGLEVLQGDFSEGEKIRAATRDADAVLVTAGDKRASKQSMFMLAFVKTLVAGMRDNGVDRLVFQSGASTSLPGAPRSMMDRLVFRPLLWLTGWSGTAEDNNAVAAWLHADAQDIRWTIVRPGMIRPKPSQGAVVASESMSSPVTFVDLARFDVEVATSGSFVHQMPWVAYAA